MAIGKAAQRGRSSRVKNTKLGVKSREKRNVAKNTAHREDVDLHSEKKTLSGPEELSQHNFLGSEEADAGSGTVDLSCAGTSGGGETVLRGISASISAAVEDDSDAESESESYDIFPQFVIDSKPDCRLTINSDDDKSDSGDFRLVHSDSDPEPGDSSEDHAAFRIDKIASVLEKFDTSNTLKDSIGSGHKDEHESSVKATSKKTKGRKSDVETSGSSTVSFEAPCEIDTGLDMGDCYVNLEDDPTSSKKAVESILLKSQQDILIKKSVLTPDFEKQHSIAPYRTALRQLKKARKKERDSTKGEGWFGMKAAEMTDELRNDIKVIRMRSTLDPKRFYKGNDMAAIPKFVQVGTVVDSPVDFYHSRVPKKQRKQTVVEELLADADARRYNKRKYMELQERFNSFPRGGKKRKFGKKSGSKKK